MGSGIHDETVVEQMLPRIRLARHWISGLVHRSMGYIVPKNVKSECHTGSRLALYHRECYLPEHWSEACQVAISDLLATKT